MFLRTIATKSLSGDLELACSKAEGKEGEAPKQDTDSLGRELLQSTDVDSLRIITEPVAKVDTLDIEFLEFLIAASDHDQLQEGIFDITMAIVDCVDLKTSQLGPPPDNQPI